MFSLPREIQCLIYEFDGTYRPEYKRMLYELEFVTPYWKIFPINKPSRFNDNLYVRQTLFSQKSRSCLYHQQAINLIKFNHKSFPTRTTDLTCESLFDIYENEYWRVFKNIKDYTPLYKKLVNKDDSKIINLKDFFKTSIGYAPRINTNHTKLKLIPN